LMPFFGTTLNDFAGCAKVTNDDVSVWQDPFSDNIIARCQNKPTSRPFQNIKWFRFFDGLEDPEDEEIFDMIERRRRILRRRGPYSEFFNRMASW